MDKKKIDEATEKLWDAFREWAIVVTVNNESLLCAALYKLKILNDLMETVHDSLMACALDMKGKKDNGKNS